MASRHFGEVNQQAIMVRIVVSPTQCDDLYFLISGRLGRLKLKRAIIRLLQALNELNGRMKAMKDLCFSYGF